MIKILGVKLYDIHGVSKFNHIWKTNDISTLLCIWPSREDNKKEPKEEFIIILFEYDFLDENRSEIDPDNFSITIKKSNGKCIDIQRIKSVKDTISDVEEAVARYIVFWGSKHNIWSRYV